MDGHYQQNLEHVAEPSRPREREATNSVSLKDWDALYFAENLREWAGYQAPNETYESIALAYVEYINNQVRANGKDFVELYAHTDEAKYALLQCAHDIDTVDSTEQKQSRRTVRTVRKVFSQGDSDASPGENSD